MLIDSPAVIRLRRAPDVEVVVNTTRPIDEADLAQRIEGAHTVLSMHGTSRFTHTVLMSAAELKHIAVWGARTDNVDLTSARRLGIAVSNTPGRGVVATAEHTMALIMALAKKIPEYDARIRSGGWPRGMSVQLNGKTIGVVGTGAVGSRVIDISRGIGLNPLAWSADVDQRRPAELRVEYTELETLLKRADIVSLHVRLSDTTRGLINKDTLALMKPTALLVNTSSGALVNEEDLVEALRSQEIGGAALDVFEEEPIPSSSRLRTLPNVILTPHAAGSTPEAVLDGLSMAVDNVLAFLEGRLENRVA